ncbi:MULTISPECIES: YjcZ family sporulation protein [Paenibacillus]|nr:YjcZ family sporulation protein [Paenibacillus caseinilyticus]MCZ8523444.1 YjcZ family sporulation protein [Paenibacillus caseinilyticus]
MGYAGGCGGVGTGFTSTGVILVLYILLVIVATAGFFI